MKPKIVVLCGSSKFVDVMAVCHWLIERDEGAIGMGLHLLPYWYCKDAIPDHLAEHEGCADKMDELHLRKIDLCDEIFVVNYDHYVGSSTRNEVEYAQKHKKKIRWFTDDPIGEKVQEIMWKQYRKKGITEMRPYIPGEDLSGISVSKEDTPEPGGMIARNSKNLNDQWYVAKQYYLDNYEEA